MKFALPCFLICISSTVFAQVKSTELLPDIVNTSSGFINSRPSMSEDQNRLCFSQVDKKAKLKKIMISDKSGNGLWSQPYAAFQLKKSEFTVGLTISANGGQIYFDLNNDIWMIEYLGGTAWSKPQRISAHVSMPDYMEILPSISRDNQVLSFIRNIKVRSLSTGAYYWQLTPFISRRLENNAWGVAQKIKVKELEKDEQVYGLHYDTERSKIFFSTGISRSDYSNYYATLKDSVCVDIRKIDFAGGFITWVSRDFKTGLIVTATEPSKMATIKFDSPIVDEAFPIAKEVVSVRDPVPAITEEKAPIRLIGKYYGLLIGVSQYEESTLSLDRPDKDVLRLKEILCSNYEFQTENVKTLTNPSRQEIISELYKLRGRITPDDNLLIFFAGHGFWDESIKQGYWWPKDARKSDPSFWLSNSDLREQIRGINSRHTLLVSDACFSGGIFKARGVDDLRSSPIEIQILYKTKSRRAITSGNLSTVPDQSVFFDYLIKRLVENNEKFISSQLLFSSLKLAVINNSLTIPQEGVINDAGDEGGDFIFIRKEK
jgi:hypothetical protein